MNTDEDSVTLEEDLEAKVRLVCFAGKYQGRVWTLKNSKTTIGREAHCDIILSDEPGVSKIHAELIFDGELYRVRDLQSRNGTRLNDQVIEESLLADGDEIRICHARFRFHRGLSQVKKESKPSWTGEQRAEVTHRVRYDEKAHRQTPFFSYGILGVVCGFVLTHYGFLYFANPSIENEPVVSSEENKDRVSTRALSDTTVVKETEGSAEEKNTVADDSNRPVKKEDIKKEHEKKWFTVESPRVQRVNLRAGLDGKFLGYVVEENQNVSKGEVVAQVEVVQDDATVQTLRIEKKKLSEKLEQTGDESTLGPEIALIDAQIRRLESENKKTLNIFANFSGVISGFTTGRGVQIDEKSTIAQLIRPEQIWVTLESDEEEIELKKLLQKKILVKMSDESQREAIVDMLGGTQEKNRIRLAFLSDIGTLQPQSILITPEMRP